MMDQTGTGTKISTLPYIYYTFDLNVGEYTYHFHRSYGFWNKSLGQTKNLPEDKPYKATVTLKVT